MQSIHAIAWRNLVAHRTRTGLSVLAVSFGVSATIAGNAIAQSVQAAILASDDMRTIMEGIVGQLDTMMAFVGAVLMLAVGFLIFNAFAMSITQRRQQIGALRALGTTRAQVLRILLVEALIIAVAGTVLGFVAGPLLSQGMIALLRQFGGGLLAFADAGPTPPTLVLAIILGIVVPVLAMLAPARLAARISPLAALRQPEAAGIEPASPIPARVGGILLIALALYLLIASPGEWVGYPEDGLLSACFMGLWIVGLVLILPAFVALAGRMTVRALAGGGVVGRLIGDNLRRGRNRVLLTIVSMAFGLMVITGLSGFIDFAILQLFAPTLSIGADRGHFFVSRLDITAGWQAMANAGLDAVLLTPEEVGAIQQIVGDRGEVAETYFVTVPELSFLGDAYYSTVAPAEALARFGDVGFNFIEGSWQTALPVMQAGCGVLVAPLVARKNGAGLGDTITVTGITGPVDCIIAGIGSSTGSSSIISAVAGPAFGAVNPVMIQVLPGRISDLPALEADLQALRTTHPLLAVTQVKGMVAMMDEGLDLILGMFNGLLLLAVMAAALSVVNTVLMSVQERQREIGLLRAVGTTRAQSRAIIMGEAALMGLIGGVFGLVAGLGVVIIFVVTYGGNSFGLSFPLWPAALEAIGPPIRIGLLGFVLAPLIAAGAAWLPARSILRRTLVDTLA